MGTPTRCKFCQEHPAECKCDELNHIGNVTIEDARRAAQRIFAGIESAIVVDKACANCGYPLDAHNAGQMIGCSDELARPALEAHSRAVGLDALETLEQKILGDHCAVCGESKQAHFGPDASTRRACYQKMAKHER